MTLGWGYLYEKMWRSRARQLVGTPWKPCYASSLLGIRFNIYRETNLRGNGAFHILESCTPEPSRSRIRTFCKTLTTSDVGGTIDTLFHVTMQLNACLPWMCYKPTQVKSWLLGFSMTTNGN